MSSKSWRKTAVKRTPERVEVAVGEIGPLGWWCAFARLESPSERRSYAYFVSSSRHPLSLSGGHGRAKTRLLIRAGIMMDPHAPTTGTPNTYVPNIRRTMTFQPIRKRCCFIPTWKKPPGEEFYYGVIMKCQRSNWFSSSAPSLNVLDSVGLHPVND